MNFEVKELIDKMEKINGSHVSICIKHMLYGNQNISCVFDMYNDVDYIGFNVNAQNICIKKSSIDDITINENNIQFRNDVMHIDITVK